MDPKPSHPDRALCCPKCDAAMPRVLFQQVEVDRCTRCQGIWLDRGEVHALRSARGAEALDTGDVRVGAALDQQPTVSCPVCAVSMDRVPDASRPHVWYERCPCCEGVFLDAGELRELTNDDVFDLFDRLMSSRSR